MMSNLFANARLDERNLLLDTDSYKASHYRQYAPGTGYVQSYIEARAPNGDIDYTLFFGLQAYLMQVLSQPICQDDIDEADAVFTAHGEPFNRTGWQHIVDMHGGKLPIRIRAVKEGTILPVRQVQLVIENTDPAAYWLPSYLETSLLRAIWYPTTVATNSWANVELIGAALEKTDGSREGLPFKLHDFGARGATSREQAGIGGAAHLIASLGTDTVSGLLFARNYYGADMAGFSIPAAEHSTMTSWGGAPGEVEAMENMLTQFPTGLVAVVSDSYDLMHAINHHWGETLREQVLARDGILVVRPDSGEPTEIVPAVIEALMDKFGEQTTSTGYRLLNDKVRVIQGDGITRESLKAILAKMDARKLAVGNVAFGMGAGLLQKMDRDTYSYAMKASAAQINGAWVDVYKDPVTAKGSKTSKRGRLALTWSQAKGYQTHEQVSDEGVPGDLLETVFENGEIKRIQTFEEIRAKAAETFTK